VTIVGLDDTDSRAGMCTTYVASRLAQRLRDHGATVGQRLLIRLNPAVDYKTRGNAALALQTDADPALALECTTTLVEALAETTHPKTNPGLVVADWTVSETPEAFETFAEETVQTVQTADAVDLLLEHEAIHARGWGNERGLVGALAAVGAGSAFDDWTFERIAHREQSRWGTPRDVDPDSVFDAADTAYPAVWDTVDRNTGQLVCVPHTPGPVLYGVRGERASAVEAVAAAFDAEPVAFATTFRTNQGTDAHVREATDGQLEPGRSYRLTGTVAAEPETREGGHVFFDIESNQRSLRAVAFEPTKRFRSHVRALRAGDTLTVCGELAEETLKLEKFAVRERRQTELVTPTCPSCERRMSSAGADQGYRCRSCETTAPEKLSRPLERTLEPGWYEVPPLARRHIAKPLVRGGFDDDIHPEQ